MNHSKVLKEIRILKANADAITNALTVLEKEVVGSGMPATSKSKKNPLVAQAVAKRRARRKKAAQGGS